MANHIANTLKLPSTATFSSLVVGDLVTDAGDAVVDDLEVNNTLIIPKYPLLPSIQPEGSIIYNTANDLIYRSDGTSWIATGVASLPPPFKVSLILLQLEMK